jgi:hypothetical protein
MTCSAKVLANSPGGGSFSYAIAHVGASAPSIASVDYAYTWNIQDNGTWDTTMIIPGTWNISCSMWITGSDYTCSTTCGTREIGNYSFTMPANSITIFTFDSYQNADPRASNPLTVSSGVEYISGAEWWYNNATYWILWNTNSTTATGKFANVYEINSAPYISIGPLGVFNTYGGLRITLASSTTPSVPASSPSPSPSPSPSCCGGGGGGDGGGGDGGGG